MAATIVNLEKGRPKVSSAMMKLKLEISTLRRIGIKTVKIIHGYGSSGSGGAIRQAAHRYLSSQQNDGKIKAFCPGENFGPFEASGRNIIEMVPELRQDPDWARQNDGITIVVLK